MKSRIDSIYIAKCLGIFIVILMHVYDTNEDAWSMSNAVNIMLHSFIMPTFMVLSGFVLGGKDFNDNWLTKKASKLILLLIVSTAVYWIFATVFPNITLLRGYFEIYKGISLPVFLYGNLQVGFGLSVAWYIFVMLQVYVVLWLIQKVKSIKWIRNVNINILVGIVIIGINVLPYYNMGFDDVKWYGCFMLVGYIIGNYKEKLKKFLWTGYIALPLFFGIGYFTNWFRDWQNLEYGSRGFTIVSRDIMDGQIALLAMMVLMIVLGGLSLVTMSRLIDKIRYVRNVFIYLGGLTLGIYLLHPLFTGITDSYVSSYVIDFCICSGATVGVKWINDRFDIKSRIKGLMNKKVKMEV